MKSAISVFVFLLIGIICRAQNQIIFFGGPQITDARYIVNESKQDTKFKYGFQAGIGMKVPFEGRLYFTPAVFYSLKGYKVKYDQYVFPPDPDASDNNVMLHTIEVGGLLQYDLSEDPDHFFISLGPTLDFQLFGKEKFNLLSGGTVNKNMKFGFAYYGHYSASAIFRIGYEHQNGSLVFAQYNLGLGNINNADNGPDIRHRAAGISVGKVLNNK